MAKCFLTGIDIQTESAYILDQGAARRALRSLKERVAAMERLLAQFTPRDSVEVFDYKSRKTAVKPQRRLVCQSVAAALSAMYPEIQLFITWPQFLARRASIVQQAQTKPNGAVAVVSPPNPVLVPTPAAPGHGVPRKKKGRKKKQKTHQARPINTEKSKGDGHVGPE